MPTTYMEKLKESADFIKTKYKETPDIGIILGSGLGNFASHLQKEMEISYGDIPHFPVSTVQGHSGKMSFTEMYGKKVVIMSGRFHFYEGYDTGQVVFPIRVMKMLGIKTLLLSNAAGSVGEGLAVGDLMIIRDHISLFVPNPLIGKNIDEFGTRFPDMSEPYSKELIAKAKAIGETNGLNLKSGVYTAVTGPTYETRAEYVLIKIAGGDAVGMSTVQEVIVAVHAGIKVFAVSVITDVGIREEDNKITHEEVLQSAKEAEPKLTTLFHELIRQI